MASVSTYLNFQGTTEAAFNFYAEVFGTEITSIMRIGDAPPMPGAPEPSDDIKRMVMNVQLPILAGHVLMGTDFVEGWGQQLEAGNNVTLNLQPDTRAETDRLFAALSPGDATAQAPAEMFWGSYFGICMDRFGIRWMFNCDEPAAS